MPNTTNFNWPTPADTDLVKDGAAAIRNLGNGVDTSLVDLKGGTTGQILSKASNADMDFAFVTPNVGDLTEVQAGTGISVASGTGPIPIVTNTMATEITAKGDLIVGTGSGTFDNLPAGTNGFTLVADSVEATGLKWVAPAGGGKVLQVVSSVITTSTTIGTTTLTDSGITATITPTSASSKVLVMINALALQNLQSSSTEDSIGGKVLRDAVTVLDFGAENLAIRGHTSSASFYELRIIPIMYLDSPATTSATTYKLQVKNGSVGGSQQIFMQFGSNPSVITLLEIGA
jgi:hypothetical protein